MAGGFIGPDTVALYRISDLEYPPSKGGIEVFHFNGATWDTLTFYDPPEPPGIDFVSNPYRFGQSLVANHSIFYVTDGINNLHALHFNGTHVEEVGFYNTSDIDGVIKNIGVCEGTSCNPAPMVFAGRRLFAPGFQAVSYFDVEITCPTGFYLSDQNSCEDIDECDLGTDMCGPHRQCVNDIGGYHCGDCDPGYEVDGQFNCSEINECSKMEDLCSKNPLRECLNTDGNYTCGPCPGGYRDEGAYDCSTIDECAENTHNCSKNPIRQCIDITPGYMCGDCPQGYTNNDPYDCYIINPTGTGSGSNPTGTGSNPTGTGSGSNPTGTGSGSNPTGTGSGSNPTGTGSGNPTGTSGPSVTTTEKNATIQNVFHIFIAVILFLLN
jgi:hypothetical protein